MKSKVLFFNIIFCFILIFGCVQTNAVLINPPLDVNEDNINTLLENAYMNRFGGLNLPLLNMSEFETFEDAEEKYMKTYQEKVNEYMNSVVLINNLNNYTKSTRFKFNTLFSSYSKSVNLYLDMHVLPELQQPEKVKEPTSSINSLLGKTTNYDLMKYVKKGYNTISPGRLWDTLLSSLAGSEYPLTEFFDLWVDGYIVPGLDFCANGCKKMVPQGICIVKDYLFITEYCNCGKKHDSAICILNKDTGEYIKTVILENLHPHVGGITYYDSGIGKQYVFITGYGKGEDDGQATIMRFDYADFVYAEDGGYISKRLDITVDVNNASFISYNKFNSKLYVGYFSDLNPFNGTGKFYKVPIVNGTVNSDASKIDSRKIELMQGCEFISKKYGIITTSGGTINSMIRIFSISEKDGSFSSAIDFLAAPPYLEEVAIDFTTGKMFCVFESGSKSYKSETLMSIDRVVVLDFKDYIEKYGGELSAPTK